MKSPPPNRLVHLELHTRDLPQACAFYSELLRWRPEQVDTESGSYLALDIAAGVGGGIVECGTPRSIWLPYVDVADIDQLGAEVMLGPREGPAGWRSVVATPAGGEIAFWQHKGCRARVMA